jgi:hypothetical protein
MAVSCCVGRYALGARQMQLEHYEEVKKNGNGEGARRRYDDTVNVLNTDAAPLPTNRNNGNDLRNSRNRRNQVAPRSASPSPAPPMSRGVSPSPAAAAFVVEGTPAAQQEQQKMQAFAAAYNHAFNMQMQQQQRDRDAQLNAARVSSHDQREQVLYGQFVPQSQATAEYPQTQPVYNAQPTYVDGRASSTTTAKVPLSSLS